MANPILTASNITRLISGLSERHVLSQSPQQYVDGFISAVSNVCPPAKLAKILQRKFYIPDDSSYSDEVFFQNACELSVSNHLKQSAVARFETEKRVNPTNGYDVDDYFEAGSFRVSLEVKTPAEQKIPLGDWAFKTMGRVPNHQQQYQKLAPALAQANPNKTVVHAKNKDCTAKDFLLSANAKFNPASGVDDLNVLFVACGYIDNISEWYAYLFASKGLFTSEPFHPPCDFRNVDVVVLSNLKYCHEHCRATYDWSLRNVFMLPCVNPHARYSCMRAAIFEGLAVFEHHLKEFVAFETDGTGVGIEIFKKLKVLHYIRGYLDAPRFGRYFPVPLQEMDRKKLESSPTRSHGSECEGV
jgi:hypothetical protein